MALIYEAVGRSFRIQCRDLNWHYSRESTYPAGPTNSEKVVVVVMVVVLFVVRSCGNHETPRISCTRNDDHQRTRVMLSSQQEQQQQEGALE